MAEPALTDLPIDEADSKTSKTNSPKDEHKAQKARQSRDLIIGLCGPIGCGIIEIEEQLTSVLTDEGYQVHSIKISQLIERFYANQLNSPLQIDQRNPAARIRQLMDAGNDLRRDFGGSICADLAISDISGLRPSNDSTEAASGSILDEDATIKKAREDFQKDKKEATLQKRAYIINQLKHPEEVKALKSIYGKLFYLVGILSDRKHREIVLEKNKDISKSDAMALIARDEKEKEGHGQHLEETLFNADFFVNNTNPNATVTKHEFERLLKLLHGGHGVTPRKEEYGMFAAYSASLQSACMSRQVGAAIMDEDGNILSIGRNDVPKYGGGLYSEDDNIQPNSRDFRCIHRDQQCHNDLHKNKLKDTIAKIIDREIREYEKDNDIDLSKFDVDALALKTVKDSPIKSLIEYSRAIHAEMDSIISLARKGKSIPPRSILFTTTFPCHNCARHIVAAGIDRIIYIEPYEKSLALTLHDDSIEIGEAQNKVKLTPFQGVSPIRYQAFFSNTTPTKQNGRLIMTDKQDRLHVEKEFVDSYMDREVKIAAAIRTATRPQSDAVATPIKPTQ